MVLWAAVILSLLAGGVIGVARSDLDLSRNLADSLAAELAADAGVRLTIARILSGAHAASADGGVESWRYHDAEVRITVTDELGRIDLNHASHDLLESLFLAAGVDAGAATDLADAIVARRAANRDGDADWNEGALQALFVRVEDLSQVPGLSPALMQRLAPALTVHSGRAFPLLRVAPPLVQEALNADAASPPAEERRVGPSGLYRIHAEALTTGGAHFAREVVAAVGGRRSQETPWSIRLWTAGERYLFLRPVTAGPAPAR